MRTIGILLAVIVVVGVVLGFSRGWFNLSSGSDGGKTNITLSVDKDKVEADKDKAVDRVQDLGHKTVDQTPSTPQKAQN